MRPVHGWLVGALVVLGAASLASAQESDEPKPGALRGITSKLGQWRDNIFKGSDDDESEFSDDTASSDERADHRSSGVLQKRPHPPRNTRGNALANDPFARAAANGRSGGPLANGPGSNLARPESGGTRGMHSQPPANGSQRIFNTAPINPLQQKLAASRESEASMPAAHATSPVLRPHTVINSHTPVAAGAGPAARVARHETRPVAASQPMVTSAPDASVSQETFTPDSEEDAQQSGSTEGATASSEFSEAKPPLEPVGDANSTTHTLYPARMAAAPSPSLPVPSAEYVEDAKPDESSAPPVSEPDMLFEHAAPQLRVTTSGPRQIIVGKEAIYQVMLHNVGQAAADEVAVRIRLPEWAEVAGSSSSSGTVERGNDASDAGGLTWFVPRLGATSEEQLTLRIIARRGKPFDLAIEYTHAPVSSEAAVEVKEPKLSLAIAGPSEVFYGEKEVYKLTLSNPGTGDAESVVVRLAPTSPEDTATASHTIGLLKAGDTKVLEIELNARRAGQLSIRAEALADGGLQSIVSHDVQVRRGELDVRLAGPAMQYSGASATYEVRIANTGNAPASNLQIAAMLPPGAKFMSATNDGRLDAREAKIVWRLASLRPGADQVLHFKCQLLQPGANRHQVICAADGDLRRSATRTTNVEAVADLTLEVRDPAGPMPVGEDTLYEITLRNRGSSQAENVELVAFFAQGLEPVSVDGGPRGTDARIDRENGQVTIGPLTSITPGQELTIRITARASRPGNHMVRAELTCPALDAKMTEDESTRFFDSDASVTTDEEDPAATAAKTSAAAESGWHSDEPASDSADGS